MTAVWAHRGASAELPENTLPAFRRAADLGADGVELDVRLSADGHVVVMHDDTVDRTTDGTGPVSGLRLAELQHLDAGGGAIVPTLAEVYDALAGTGMTINVELKDDAEHHLGLPQAALDVTVRHGMLPRVRFSSFNHYGLATLRAARPDVKLGLLYSTALWQPWHYALRFGGDVALHPQHLTLLAGDVLEPARAAGVPVHCWTVDDDDHLWRLLAVGVDAVITNDPARALEMREGVRG